MEQCIFDLGIINYNPCHYMDCTCCIFLLNQPLCKTDTESEEMSL